MDTLEGEGAPGAVSSETAVILAEELLVRTGSDYGISVTGVAGPSPSEGKPVGLVYLGLLKSTRQRKYSRLGSLGTENRLNIERRREHSMSCGNSCKITRNQL